MFGPFKTFVTRFKPSLEVAAFLAFLFFCEVLRKKIRLDPKFDVKVIPAGSLRWSEFKGRTPEQLENKGFLLFDVGGGDEGVRWDQHGREGNNCSLDLVLKDCGFLAEHPALREIYHLVAENDRSGEAVCSGQGKDYHPRNLRAAMQALNAKYPHKAELVLKFSALGFCGAFALAEEKARKSERVNHPLCEESVLEGVALYDPNSLERFKAVLAEAWMHARLDLIRAKRNYWDWRGERRGPVRFNTATHLDVGRPLTVVGFKSDAYRAGEFARKKRFKGQRPDIVIVVNSAGHIGITSRFIKLKDGRTVRVNLGPLAAALRRKEAEVRGISLPAGDPEQTGFLADGGLEIPWYFAEFLTMVANGTMGNQIVPITKIGIRDIKEIIRATLPLCKLKEQVRRRSVS